MYWTEQTCAFLPPQKILLDSASVEGTPAKDERYLVRLLLRPHPSLRLSDSVALCWEDHISALLLLKVFWFPKVLRLVERDKTTPRSSVCLRVLPFTSGFAARLRDNERLLESP